MGPSRGPIALLHMGPSDDQTYALEKAGPSVAGEYGPRKKSAESPENSRAKNDQKSKIPKIKPLFPKCPQGQIYRENTG